MGTNGNAVPLQTFQELLAGIGSDGSRAHSLTETCDSAVTAAPQISAVMNAASFVGGAVSPGEIVSLFGSNLTGTVTFDGTAATAIYASPAQVNVTVPYTIAGPTTTIRMGSASVQVPVAAAAPGIFAAVSTAPGTITLYATGGGALGSGSPAPLAFPSSVTVNGEPATVFLPVSHQACRKAPTRSTSSYRRMRRPERSASSRP